MDSGSPRIDKIIALIRESKYGIHDLSRIKAKKKGEYARLNMPFELGIDVGCRLFGKGEQASKTCLILEAERYRYQAALSDLSGSDIAAHHSDPPTALKVVRDWLNNQARLHAEGPTAIFDTFNEFMGDNYDALVARGFSPQDVEKLSIPELMDSMTEWLRVRRTNDD